MKKKKLPEKLMKKLYPDWYRKKKSLESTSSDWDIDRYEQFRIDKKESLSELSMSRSLLTFKDF